MKVLLIFLGLWAVASFSENPPPAEPEILTPFQLRHLLREARALYTAEGDDPESLAEAAQAFRVAAEHSAPGEVNLDAARLAEAMAWMRANQPEAAIDAFDRIQGFDKASDRARHHLLSGNARLAAGESAFSDEDFDTAKTRMNEAIEAYIRSLMEDPSAEAAKQNLEIARRRLRFVEENEPPPPPPQEEDSDEDSEDNGEDQEPPPPQPGEGEEGEEEEEQQSDPAETDPGEGEESDPSTPEQEEEGDGESTGEELELDDFTDEEAERTLDALLEQERRLRDEIIRNRQGRPIPVEKDW